MLCLSRYRLREKEGGVCQKKTDCVMCSGSADGGGKVEEEEEEEING